MNKIEIQINKLMTTSSHFESVFVSNTKPVKNGFLLAGSILLSSRILKRGCLVTFTIKSP